MSTEYLTSQKMGRYSVALHRVCKAISINMLCFKHIDDFTNVILILKRI